MAAKPHTVIFDLGAVLIDWNPRYLYRKIFDDEARIEWLLREVCHHDWNLAMDKGRPFAEAVAEAAAQYPDYAPAIYAYHKRWIEMIGGPIEGTVKLLEQLVARNTALFALTNWSAETFPLIRHDETYGFLNHFQKIIVSGEIKMIKPDEEIFDYTLKEIEREPSDCLFIDDNPANIATARSMGFHVHHFENPAALEQDLISWELLAAP